MIWEAEFLQSLQAIRTPFLDKLMEIFSLLGEHGIVAIITTILLLIFAKTRKTGVQVLFALVLTYIIGNLIIKNVVVRVRPYDAYEFLIPLGKIPHDWSFPSGHASNNFAVAVAIFLCHKKSGIIALVITTLIAFSRLYNCVHYPTDVLAGIALGAIIAILVHYLVFPACEKGFHRLRAKKEN